MPPFLDRLLSRASVALPVRGAAVYACVDDGAAICVAATGALASVLGARLDGADVPVAVQLAQPGLVTSSEGETSARRGERPSPAQPAVHVPLRGERDELLGVLALAPMPDAPDEAARARQDAVLELLVSSLLAQLAQLARAGAPSPVSCEADRTSLLAALPDGAVVHREGTVPFANQAVAELFGVAGSPATVAVLQGVGAVAQAQGDVQETASRLRRTEVARAEGEASLRQVLAQLPDGVVVNRAGTIVFANEAAARLVGETSAPGMLGRAALEYVDETERAQLSLDLCALAAGEAGARRRRMRRRPDGSQTIVESHAARLEFEGDLAIVAVLRDITAIEAVREAQRESEERLRSILASMAEGVVLQAPGGAILFANAAAERILGLSREELEGRSSYDPRWHIVREDGTVLRGEEHPAMVTLRTGERQERVLLGRRSARNPHKSGKIPPISAPS